MGLEAQQLPKPGGRPLFSLCSPGGPISALVAPADSVLFDVPAEACDHAAIAAPADGLHPVHASEGLVDGAAEILFGNRLPAAGAKARQFVPLGAVLVSDWEILR